MRWDDLSMANRAAYIKLGLDNGITDLKVIRDTYNKYATGGYTDCNGDNNVSPQYVPEGYTPYQGEIRQAPTTSDRIVNKVKDVGRAVAAFVPFLGTALDYYDDNMQQIPIGIVGDASDILNYSGYKIGNKAENMSKASIRSKRGQVRRALLHNANKKLGSEIGKVLPKAARGLGVAGMVIDTPNFVSDIENLKRALGFNYNAGLILK